MPDRERTWLLGSALWPRPRAREAFRGWQASAPAPTVRMADDRRGARLLAPLICERLGDETEELDPRLMTYLRTARVREELRSAEYRRICAALVESLTGTVPFVLAGGAALAETVYPRPELRHSHGISILVEEGDRRVVAGMIGEAGFRIKDAAGEPGIALHAVHGSGLRLWVRTGLLPFPGWDGLIDRARDRAEERPLLGSCVRVLDPADRLFHVLARAAAGERRDTLLWASDAYRLVERETDLDWDRCVDHASRVGAALPVWVLVRYLAGRLEAPVPGRALEGLEASARDAGVVGRELALFGAAMRPGPKLVPFVRRARSWRDRFDVLRWRFIPSPGALAAAGRVRDRASAPYFYLARPIRLVARLAAARLTPDRPSSR